MRACGDNGILIWRSEIGEDATIVTANRIERIYAKSAAVAKMVMVSMCSAQAR